jgi:hypothetical protein
VRSRVSLPPGFQRGTVTESRRAATQQHEQNP